MSDSTKPHKELANTYFVQNHFQKDELNRLAVQDQMMTQGMGGVLPEQPDPTVFQHVLDIGCGVGHWLVEFAKTYPTASQLVGVDINIGMVEKARSLAEAAHLSERIQFRVMDALRMLEFPSDSFDLVNQRFGDSYLRTWDWPKFLTESQRVLKWNGVIRLTEAGPLVSNSPALTRLGDILVHALYQSRHQFTDAADGMISELQPLLQRYGFQNVQTHTHLLSYQSGTEAVRLLYEDMKYVYRVMVPFFSKWSHLPADYESVYNQALHDMQEPDFEATWTILTAWGNAPSNN